MPVLPRSLWGALASSSSYPTHSKSRGTARICDLYPLRRIGRGRCARRAGNARDAAWVKSSENRNNIHDGSDFKSVYSARTRKKFAPTSFKPCFSPNATASHERRSSSAVPCSTSPSGTVNPVDDAGSWNSRNAASFVRLWVMHNDVKNTYCICGCRMRGEARVDGTRRSRSWS